MDNDNNKPTIREAISLNLRGYKMWWDKYPMMLVSSGVHAAVEALSPYVGIYLVAQIINEIAGGRNLDLLIRLTVITLISTAGLSLITAGLLRWKNYHKAGEYYRCEKFYTDKLLTMDFRDVDAPHTHDLLSQIQQNDNWSGWGLSKLIDGYDNFVRSLLSIIGAIALTVSLFVAAVPDNVGWLAILNHPLFILAIIIVMLVVTLASPALSIKGQSYMVKATDNMKMANRIFAYCIILGMDRAKALDMRIYRQDNMAKKYLDHMVAGSHPESIFYGMSKVVRGPMAYYSGAAAMVSHIFTAIIYIFICLKAWGGAFGVGSITQYIRAITAMAAGVSSLFQFLGELYNNTVFLRTTFELLDIPNEMYQGSLTTEKRSDNKYAVEFRNVSFKYPGQEEYALQNISLTFNIGQRLAVVGQNGSGKTTFIKLLCRLYDPTEGEILLNGIDIRKYDYQQYMDIFSVVFQDFNLLSFELGQNVAASAEYDREQAVGCLAKAGISNNGEKWPLETYLYKDFEEKGIDVSGGEAQKIAIARALYKDAPFVILDEPTAALDPIAEFEIYSKMNEMMGDKTAVFISHRLSSCRFCDDIAVFDKGQLAQRGSHDDLVADADGKYFELWDAQAGYYMEEAG
ncbi:MAG: ABC transporter ATP-binding protein/permease [Defluviitaleaceae bacterium]|nr:ABC transporter ATP-binding protein/permease [Defluviitaleaceae bacterium]